MGDFIVFSIKLALFLFGLYLVYRIAKIIMEMIRLVKLKRSADELRKKFDLFSVEGEVLNFVSKRISKLDTQYDVYVSYKVNDITYYKYITVFNRGSLRVGQRVMLLCDNDDCSNAVLQNGEEEYALKKLISHLVWTIILLIFDAVGNSMAVLDLAGDLSSFFGG